MPLIRRLVTPAGLLLAAGCLLLPFLSGGCSSASLPAAPPLSPQEAWQVSYTGGDIVVGGRPEIAVAGAQSDGQLRRLDDADVVDLLGQPAPPLRPQPLAWLALALLAAGLAATALRAARRRAATVAGAALLAALALYAATLLARDQAVEATAEALRRIYSMSPPTGPVREWEYFPWLAGQFTFGYGFWTVEALLVVIGMTNVALSVPSGVTAGPRRRERQERRL